VTTVWVDGVLLPADAAVVSVDDRGFLLGEGVFDTLLAKGGVLHAPTRHLARLRRSAAALGLRVPFDDATLRAALDAVAATGPARARVRITVTAGTVVVAASPCAPRRSHDSVVVAPWPVNERSPVAGIKHTSRVELLAALAHAQEQGADEALLATSDGRLCEGTSSNVFVVVDGRLATPSLASGCLPGVTRELVLELTGAEEADVPMSSLAEVEEAFLTSAIRGVRPIGLLDGRALLSGPRTEEAARAYEALVAANPDP
jgi:branched-chain amino acid aminotransferase